MPRFGFSQVHILESLPAGEPHSGRVLRMSILKDKPEDVDRVHLHEIEDAATVRSVLTAIGIEAENPDRYPYIHLECHGCPDGLVLASGELITWDELSDLLRPINVATRLNLFVSLATCHGERLVYAMNPVAAAPAWGLVGPRAEIDGRSLLSFFSRFFASLLSDPSIERALGTDGGPPGARLPIVYWSAAHFFEGVFRFYLEEEGTSARRRARADELARRILGPHSAPEQRRTLARELRRDLRDHGRWFEKYRRQFLMLDEFAENDQRFPRSWEKLQSEI